MIQMKKQLVIATVQQVLCKNEKYVGRIQKALRPWFLLHLDTCKMYFCQCCFLYQWPTEKLHYGHVSLYTFLTSLETKTVTVINRTCQEDA